MPPTLADRMRRHAADSEHLYAVLMRAMADDWEAGGPVREICHGWEDAPQGAVVQLRLLAGLFRLVLTDRAPELVPFYACLGGTEGPAGAWPPVRRVLAAHVDELHEALEVPPQTNEVGRSTALLIGIFDAVRHTGLRKVSLLEPGASAGLNLLVDRFHHVGDGWSYGPESSPLQLRDFVVGTLETAAFDVVARRGCDVAPVDPLSQAGRLRLRSFVWPFHIERHARLSAALQIAAAHPVNVDATSAGEWLEERLASPAPGDVLTVVWQSITRQYWPSGEIARAARAIAAAATGGPVVHVSMEYPDDAPPTPAELVVSGPAGVGPRRLATVGDHGTPIRMLSGEFH